MVQDETVAETSGICISASPYSLRGGFQERLSQTGSHEPNETARAIELLRLRDRVLEPGANLGVVSAALAKTGLPSSTLSYQANPDLFEHIDRQHVANELADLIELRNSLVVSNPEPAAVPFHVSDRFAYFLSLSLGERARARFLFELSILAKLSAAFTPTLWSSTLREVRIYSLRGPIFRVFLVLVLNFIRVFIALRECLPASGYRLTTVLALLKESRRAPFVVLPADELGR